MFSSAVSQERDANKSLPLTVPQCWTSNMAKAANFLRSPRRSMLQPMNNSRTGSGLVLSFSGGDIKSFKVTLRSLQHIGIADFKSCGTCLSQASIL